MTNYILLSEAYRDDETKETARKRSGHKVSYL